MSAARSQGARSLQRGLRGLGLLVTAVAVACSPGPNEPDEWSVLLVTLDTTRADHLGAYGYPHVDTPTLDALAAEGIRYERCYSPVPLTLPSHASLFTGLLPPRHAVRVNGENALSGDATTLAELLGEEGYATGAAVGAFVLDRSFGLAQGFDAYDDDLSAGTDPGRFAYAERDARLVTDSALDWLSRNGGGSFFLWVHYFDPHAPYAAPDTEAAALRGRTPYDAEIGYVDSQLRRLLDDLDESGAAERTLVVVTGDHGEGLWEHGELSHGLFAYESTLQVPLIVRFPDGRGARTSVSEPVSLVDVMPSILGWLGQAPPGDLDGRPLPLEDAPAEAATERAIYFENRGPAYTFGWSPLRGFVSGDLKFIEAPRPELYDLRDDPYETEDRFAAGSERSAEAQQRFATLLAELEAAPSLARRALDLDEQSREKLLALGYAAGPGGREARDWQADGRADPKDRVRVHQQIMTSLGQIEQGQVAEGVNGLARVLASEDPGNRRAVTVLAHLALDDEARPRAIEALRAYSRRSPEDPELDLYARSRLGMALAREGRHEEAIEAFLLALAVDPDRPGLQYNLGLSYEQTGDRKKAAAAYRRALELAGEGDAHANADWLDETRGRLAALERRP